MSRRRFVMMASAVVMGLAGLAASFAPQEIAGAIGAPDSAAVSLIVQLAGALYLSLAIANWTARESLIGGIYSRPLALANLLHFTMGALTLVRRAAGGDPAILFLTAIYTLFAMAFGAIFFTSPVSAEAVRSE